jgi:plasmid stabilization system protein ParE
MAEGDLAGIVAYVGADNPAAARRVFEEIKEQISLLADYPQIGRHGRVRGTRELVIVRTPYIAAYRMTAAAVRILRGLHGARRWPRRLP